MRGITAKMRALAITETIQVDEISRDGIYVIARRLKIKVSVEKVGEKIFDVTRVRDNTPSLPELRKRV